MLPLLLAITQSAQVQLPRPDESDFVIPQVQLADGETLSNVRLHVSTFGHPSKGANGQVTNAVLIMHGTGGSGHSLINPIFAGQLFGPSQPLDISKYFIILPDALGHGRSSSRAMVCMPSSHITDTATSSSFNTGSSPSTSASTTYAS